MSFSLEETLAQKARELEEQKQIEQQNIENERIATIQENINSLEQQIAELKILSNEIEAKLTVTDDVGEESQGKTKIEKKEYRIQLEDSVENARQKILALMEKHKAVLDSLSIQSFEEMITHEHMKDGQEVTTYIEAKKRLDQLPEHENELKNKLQQYNIPHEGEEFSFIRAEEQVNSLISSHEEEKFQLELQTPEGRQRIKTILLEELKNAGANLSMISSVHMEGEYNIRFGRRSDEVIYICSHNGLRLEGNDSPVTKDIVPENITELYERYGKDLVDETLHDLYRKRLDNAIREYDSQNDDNYALLESLEPINENARDKARLALEKYMSAKREFFDVLKEREEYFKRKGITFNSEYASSYGGRYSELINIFSYDGTLSNIQNDIRSEKFPPEYNFIELASYITEEIPKIQKFIDAISRLETQDDIDLLLEGSAETKPQLDSLRLDLEDYKGKQIHNAFRFTFPGRTTIAHTAISDLKKNASNYRDAVYYLNKKLGPLEEVKKNLEPVIDAQVSKGIFIYEASNEMKKNGLVQSPYRLKEFIEEKNRDKQKLEELQKELLKIKAVLKSDELITLTLNPDSIKRKAISDEAKSQREEMDALLTKIQAKEKELKESKSQSLGLFNWKKDRLMEEQKVLQDEINTFNNQYLVKEYEYRNTTNNQYISTDRSYLFGDIERVLKDKINKKEGTFEEVFGSVVQEIEDQIEANKQSISPSLLKLRDNLEELNAKNEELIRDASENFKR